MISLTMAHIRNGNTQGKQQQHQHQSNKGPLARTSKADRPLQTVPSHERAAPETTKDQQQHQQQQQQQQDKKKRSSSSEKSLDEKDFANNRRSSTRRIRNGGHGRAHQ